MNGTYAQNQPQSYDQSYSSQNGTSQSNGDYNTSSTANNGTTNGNNGSGSSTEIPKDEVGWYFVEQYYTALSRSPEKLYLFYNKRSQFVSGTEAEKVAVCVGQKAINDRIKELDFHECKVRVTNVDSQASGSNIVIQVIGEISTKSLPQKKFTQTFVLAEQANGYFVLNDIFRYLLEDDEEAEGMEDVQPTAAETGHQEQASSTVADATPATLTSSNDASAQEHDASIVDQALEKAADTPPAVVQDQQIEGVPETADVAHAEEAPAAAMNSTTEQAQQAEPTPAPLEEVPTHLQEEKPKDPEPTPMASPPKSAAAPAQAPAAAPAAPAKPSAPKTWASMFAGKAPVPAIPSPSPAAAPKAAPTASVPAPQSAAPKPVEVQASVPEAPEPSSTPVSTGSEWQTAGADHKKQQNRQQQNVQAPKEGHQGYIKSIPENTDQAALKAALSKVSEVVYIDINRAKSCAFVDYASPAAYKAAVAANPYEFNGQNLVIEERRFKTGGPGFPPRGGMGGRGGRGGAPGQGAPRGGMQRDGGRGNFGAGRGGPRGGMAGRGGRGGAQPAA